MAAGGETLERITLGAAQGDHVSDTARRCVIVGVQRQTRVLAPNRRQTSKSPRPSTTRSLKTRMESDTLPVGGQCLARDGDFTGRVQDVQKPCEQATTGLMSGMWRAEAMLRRRTAAGPLCLLVFVRLAIDSVPLPTARRVPRALPLHPRRLLAHPRRSDR